MPESALLKFNRPLHWFAVLTALFTFLLLGAGGLVTSHEAGMSVPDWPNSFGYNPFALPFKFWKGGVFFEHTHRLIASAVGLLTTILAVWLWLKDTRRWVQWLGVASFLLVVVQGILGGMRVVLSEAELGAIHGIVGQCFFVLMSTIALFTGRFWAKWSAEKEMSGATRGLKMLVLAATLLIFWQLILGATMRGEHAGLAITDFPTAYGQVWPDTSPAAVSHYNADRMDVVAEDPITAFQIILQMVHRIVALAILILVVASAWRAWRQLGWKNPLAKLAVAWLTLIVCQIGLGAATIWTNKAADVATAHVLGGALSLVTGALWCVIAFRRSAALPEIAPAATISGAYGGAPVLAANK
jgi:cytochrome c oxidase assembly protein subunit 15